MKRILCLPLAFLILFLQATLCCAKTYTTQIDTSKQKINYHTFKPDDKKANGITKNYKKYNKYPIKAEMPPIYEFENEKINAKTRKKIYFQDGDYIVLSQRYLISEYFTVPEYHKDGSLMGWIICKPLIIKERRRTYEFFEFRVTNKNLSHYEGKLKHVMFLDIQNGIKNQNVSQYLFVSNEDSSDWTLKGYTKNNDVYTLEGEQNIIPTVQNIEITSDETETIEESIMALLRRGRFELVYIAEFPIYLVVFIYAVLSK